MYCSSLPELKIIKRHIAAFKFNLQIYKIDREPFEN